MTDGVRVRRSKGNASSLDEFVSVDHVRFRHILNVPGERDHKYTRGVAGLVVGSVTYPGAALLACAGAEAAGPGMIRLDAPADIQRMVLTSHPGIVTSGGQIQAGLIGPGMDDDRVDAATDLATFCLESQLPLVVDAGALSVVPSWVQARPLDTARAAGTANPPEEPSASPALQTAVLTPHAGEAARLASALGQRTSRADVDADPVTTARMLAEHTGAITVLKGSHTYIASPHGTLEVVGPGLGWTGVAGAGDVLAGVLVGLLAGWRARTARSSQSAQSADDSSSLASAGASSSFPTESEGASWGGGAASSSFMDTVVAGVWIHAEAGKRAALRHGPAGGPIAALDIAREIPSVIGGLLA
ncbi:NAD(P)H-hydrate dehydratase [Schaalia sp. ZJ405]|uniref:ADP-dependent NAD(P)H-hydrate dehydratase n=1 Tax=Schaalia sp. ZJ405 TaxID=2709403 RepID=UPI0013EB26FF|nr:ADP/ATP-dependent (S)-NAD(P)H-hydrate dehydratase [Schaalia sp. ZJ405]QPK80958.1 NAD(P)H-hydrate dehydratase [Schaalia sp. ZJ405]